MYGSFICLTNKSGKFGSIMCIGHTLGEEILSSDSTVNYPHIERPNDQPLSYVKRSESVVSNDYSCVLQLNINHFNVMRIQRHIVAGGGDMLNDFAVLMYIFESHLVQKNNWRLRVKAPTFS